MFKILKIGLVRWQKLQRSNDSNLFFRDYHNSKFLDKSQGFCDGLQKGVFLIAVKA